MLRRDTFIASGDAPSSKVVVPEITSVATKTIPGQLAAANANSMSWSCNGLLAFGCQNQVVIADTKEPMAIVQTLDKHKYVVSKVKWPKDNSTRLVSCDIKSNIIIWDVMEGSVLNIIDSKEFKKVINLHWVQNEKNSDKNGAESLLLVLYSSNTIVLFDAEHGEPTWRKTLGSVDFTIKDLVLDPFNKGQATISLTSSNPNNCSFATMEGCTSNTMVMKRYQLSVRNEPASSPTKSPNNKVQLQVKLVASSLAKESDEVSSYLLEYHQLTYNKSRRDEIFVAFAREIVVINLINSQIMTVINTERDSTGLLEIFSCRQRSALISLHESGNVALRLMQRNVRYEDHISADIADINYATLCQSGGIRLMKQNKIEAFAVSPICETKIALLLNNGKILVEQIMRKGSKQDGMLKTLADIIPIDFYDVKKSEGNKLKDQFRMMQCQMLGSLMPPSVIRSCPPITRYNWSFHRPLLASGHESGTIQIFDVATGSLEKEFSIHSSPVRGIEWVSLNAFLSFSYPSLPRNFTGEVKNELFITEIYSGRSEAIKSDKSPNSSPIESVKVSHLKQYFIVAFKSEPFEIWDLKSLCLLRTMPKKFASVTAVEWSPLYNKKQSVVKSQDDDKGSRGEVSGDGQSRDTLATNQVTRSLVSIKENFVVTNGHGELYHFSVEGMITKEISCIPRDASHGYITCIAWKGDQVILGDADGNLHFWYLKKKQSSTKTSHRGWIKKVRFAPGRGSMKCIVLYSDGAEIWDATDMTVYSELKVPRDVTFKVVDVDWAGSDRPILANSDGFVLVTDLKLRTYTSPMRLNSDKDVPLMKINSVLVDPNIRTKLISKYLHDAESTSTLLDRCLQVAKITGDRNAVDFWQLVGHHVTDEDKYQTLDDNYEQFLKNDRYREIQRARVATFEMKRLKQEQNELCCEYYILLRNHQRAVQLLLESDSMARDAYYKNALKACLIASLQATARVDNLSIDSESLDFADSSAQPVVKLVATSLIASGAVDEGVQLLYLIGKVQDACRYLQSNGRWDKSVWVAKTFLTDEESQETVRKWLDHLLLNNHRDNELFILLSTRNFEKVLETLTNRQELQVAALFADLCSEHQVLPAEAKVTVDFVYLKYAQWLLEYDLEDVAQQYKDKVSQE
ncbi:WD repeat-containing protein 11 [Halotydeus destructor]|nr:WD repeat-containing protein 11 [Halotydeus destructor]